MEPCSGCIYYNDSNTYPGTGYCSMIEDFVGANDSCEDFEGEE